MKNNKTINVLFGGTGGQGVLKAVEILGWAAIYEGYHAKKSEVHGMAQRGGSVESHLRFGQQVFSPLIPIGQVDYLVSFHAGEQERLKNSLAPQGVDLLKYLQLGEKTLTNKNYLNTYLLGVLAKYLPIKPENWQKALTKSLPAKYLEDNLKVFQQGKGAEA